MTLAFVLQEILYKSLYIYVYVLSLVQIIVEVHRQIDLPEIVHSFFPMWYANRIQINVDTKEWFFKNL